MVGERLPEMLKSRACCYKYLSDPSWEVRAGALSILSIAFESDDELARICETAAFEDAHPQVRGIALLGLACCFEGTDDAKIGKLLAEVVADSRAPSGLRESAYAGLFWVRGVPLLQRPRHGLVRVPDGVDWGFVRSFL